MSTPSGTNRARGPSVAARPDGALSRRVRLERQLLRVRWFGVALGLYQVWATYRPPAGPRAPAYLRPAGYAMLAGLAIMNVVIAVRLRGRLSEPAARRLGVVVFAADAAAVFGFIWLYSFDANATTWATLLVLPLEGAHRHRLWGAMAPVAAALPLEAAREAYRLAAFGFPAHVDGVVYRVGLMGIVAVVAGLMARGLERERRQAESRARELGTFQDVVLAGAAGSTLEESVARIVETMARGLGYEAFAVAVFEEGKEAPALRCVAAHGFTASAVGRSLRLGEGAAGRAAATGEPQLVRDTGEDPRYAELVPGARSEMCVPIHAHDRPIGVVAVGSPIPGRYGPEDLARLARLAPQIGLIMSNARLLARERAAVARLRELDAMKSDFVAIASHELRTPLTGISVAIKTLRRKYPRLRPEELEHLARIVDDQTESLIRLVEDLLTVSRVEGGGPDLRLGRVSVGRVVSEAVRGAGDDGRVRVEVGGGAAEVVTDADRLTQALRNLVENALKFSEPGDPVLVTATREGGEVVLEVTDRGPGIPEADLERIFERFHQVGGAMGRRAGGIGLGLYIARALVEALGGSVQVESRPGEGTTFRIRLPLGTPEAAAGRPAFAAAPEPLSGRR